MEKDNLSYYFWYRSLLRQFFSTEVVGSGAGCEVEGGGGGRARFAAEDLPFLDGAGLLGGGWDTTLLVVIVDFCSNSSCCSEVVVDCCIVLVDKVLVVCFTSEAVCFKCLAIRASADSEKCMLLALSSTATLTTLTDGSTATAAVAVFVRQGAAVSALWLAALLSMPPFWSPVSEDTLLSAKVSPIVRVGNGVFRPLSPPSRGFSQWATVSWTCMVPWVASAMIFLSTDTPRSSGR